MVTPGVWKRILWAVDPFEGPGGVRERVVRTLQDIQRRTPVAIQPVYVLSPSELNLSVDLDLTAIEQYLPTAEAALNRFVEQCGLKSLDTPKVIGHGSSSIRDAVDRLSSYAIGSGADLIVTGTHGRGGVIRILLGSFAETLLLHSSVPSLVVGKEGGASLDRLLFATDLDPASLQYFDRAVRLASQLGSRLSIFHALPNPVEPIFQSGMFLLGGAWIPVHHYFSEDAEQRRRLIEEWAERARAQGVETETRISEQNEGVADALISYSEEIGAGMIAMAAQSGAVRTTLVGSISRNVVRHSRCPVWILHPAREEMRGEEAA